jgi:DNA modification methylase
MSTPSAERLTDAVTLYQGDCLDSLRAMPDASVHCCVTSPPYFGLRDYKCEGQIGLEPTPDEFVEKLVAVFREVRRVLRDDATLWLNLGDSYANDGKWGGHTGGKHAKALHCSPIGRNKKYTGLKPKDLIGIPWMVAFALRSDGWFLRQDIIWHKPSPMPESVRDRCTKSHEHIFLLSKSPRYHFDHEAIKEPASYAGLPRGGSKNRYEQNDAGMDCKVYDTRNKRSVWTVRPAAYKGAHFATFPIELIAPCILAGCPDGGTVLDPFGGSGTTAIAAMRQGKAAAVLCELNPDYCSLIRERVAAEPANLFSSAEVAS